MMCWRQRPARWCGVLQLAALVALHAGVCDACTLPQVEIDACSGKAANAACTFSRGGSAVCGECRAHAECTLTCAPGSTGCAAATGEAEVTCAKQPTGTGGFGIVQPCQDTSIVPEASAPVFAETRSAESLNGVLDITLNVQPFVLDTGAFKVQARGYCYEGVCSYPGPTIVTYPGDVVSVTVQNDLSDAVPEQATSDGDGVNALRKANYTNLHTHGLHVDPYTDNVIAGIAPGSSRTYRHIIPATHMPGTSWYHSHQHGASSLQVMGGLFGMWVVQPKKDAPLPEAMLTSAAANASWWEMPAFRMTVSHFSLCSCNPTSDPFRIFSYQQLRDLTGDNMQMNVQMASDVTDVLLVNGQRQPVLDIRTGVWNRLELLNAVGDVFLEVEIRTGVAFGGGGTGAACDMKLLSLDGVLLLNGIRDVQHINLAPGTRAGVAVRCATSGTFYLQSNPANRAADYEATFLQNLVTLRASVAGGQHGPTDAPAWGEADIRRPAYLQDLRAKTAAAQWELGVEQTSVSGGGAWLGVGTECSLAVSGRDGATAPDPNSEGQCVYQAFGQSNYRHVGRMCDVEDVVVNGRGATPHPMHIHVNHFQVVSYTRNGQDASGETQFTSWGVVGDWRDTFPALTGRVTLRHVLDGFGGNVMVHCHFLPHEDMGMMDRFWVAGQEGAPACAATYDAARSASYCAAPAAAVDTEYPRVAGTCLGYRQTATEVLPTALPPSDATSAPPTSAPQSGGPTTAAPTGRDPNAAVAVAPMTVVWLALLMSCLM